VIGHGNRSTDSTLALRVLCGVFATLVAPLALIGIVKYGLARDWLETLYRVSLLPGAWVFGYLAFTGRFPKRWPGQPPIDRESTPAKPGD